MKSQEKHTYILYVKGEMPATRFSTLDFASFSDIKFGEGGIKITCTEQEKDLFIEQTFKDDKIKLIGIENLSDTLIEVKDAINDDGSESDMMLIVDLDNKNKGYYLSKTDVESLLESNYDRSRLYSDNYGYPVKFYVNKKELEKLIDK